jgi:hypothetical protein
MPVIYPGQDEIADRPDESDLPNALAALDGVIETDEEDEATAENGPKVEPFPCSFKEDGKTPVDCQLNRALEILADATAYNQAIADAGAARTEH